MKQQIVSTLRKTHTLAAVERGRYVGHRVKGARSNRTFTAAHPGDPMPPPWMTYDAFATIDYRKYWETGKARASFIADRAREHLDSPGPVYDWGCGPGRVARHLVGDDAFSEVLASDYNPATIAWCRSALPGVRWRVNDLQPPLPVADGSVAMVYSFSVLTHLSSQMLHSWMVEQRRIVRPGGLIFVTTHGDQFRPILLPDEQRAYDTTGLVVRGGVKEGSRIFATFTSPTYVRTVLAAGLEVLLHEEGGALGGWPQDVWLLKTPT